LFEETLKLYDSIKNSNKNKENKDLSQEKAIVKNMEDENSVKININLQGESSNIFFLFINFKNF
jgi:hypothetical protein